MRKALPARRHLLPFALLLLTFPGLGVNPVNHVPVFLVNDAALDLEGGREFAAFDREFVFEEGDALDPLEAGEVLCERVHLALEEVEDARVAAELRRGFEVEALELRVGAEHLPVGDDEGGGELAAVAYKDDLADEARLLDAPLQDLRGDVLAARSLEQLLLAVGDAQVALRVERAHIAGLEPAVGGEGRGRLLRLVVVAEHDVRAARLYLAVGRC